MANPDISIVIPNWNGERLIARCLSPALYAARQAGRETEVVVVDDASADAGCERIRREFPQVRLLVNEENLGFGQTVNRGVEAATGRIVVLLNNDVAVMKDFVARLMRHFDDDEGLFGVSALTVEWESHEPNHAWMAGALEDGRFALRWEHPAEARPAMFLQGGGCALRRDRFLELGGFDPIFEPGYWEDYDLSFRALARGWRIRYDPAARALHVGRASFAARYGDDGVRQLARRNEFLFAWLNLEGRGGLAQLPRRLAGEVWRHDTTGIKAFAKAATKWRAAATGRKLRQTQRTIGDAEIFGAFAGMGNPQ